MPNDKAGKARNAVSSPWSSGITATEPTEIAWLPADEVWR
jgi:hypothetical protein